MRKRTIALVMTAMVLSFGWLMGQSVLEDPAIVTRGTPQNKEKESDQSGRFSYNAKLESSVPFAKTMSSDTGTRDFGDKVLLVTYCPKDGPNGGIKYGIKKASVHKIGERWFLSGSMCGDFTGQASFADSVLRIPFNEVALIYEFDSLDAAKKALDIR